MSLSNYLDGLIDLSSGYSPVVFTFYDSTLGQFRYSDGDQGPELDPDCAVAILLEFHQRHPDFGLAATFFVSWPVPFGQPKYVEQKLRQLVAWGFEIGNHTWEHRDLSQLGDDEVARQLALPVLWVDRLVPGYRVDALALPYGAIPRPSAPLSGEHDGIAYVCRSVLLVGSDPAPSPYSRQFNPLRLPRIQAIDSEFVRWFPHLGSEHDGRFVGDGDPLAVSFPEHLSSRLDDQFRDRAVPCAPGDRNPPSGPGRP